MKQIDVSKLEKLPKWAQEHIEDLNRERNSAIKKLNDFVDEQTPSPFYIDEHVCTGEECGPSRKRKYIQGYKMRVDHQGVSLNILLKDYYIDIKWGESCFSSKEIAFIPTSYQQAKLVNKKNMI